MNLLDELLSRPIAHRGLHNNNYPENTIGAIQNALVKGYNIEIDIMMSSDKKIVAFHDDNLKRLTGVDRLLNTCSYNELSQLNILSSNESIPLLDDILSLVDDKVCLVIEIKHHEYIGDLEDILMTLLKDYKNYVIQSFDPQIIEYIKKNYPSVIVGLISGDLKEEYFLSPLDKFLSKYLFYIFKFDIDFIAYQKEYNLFWVKFVTKLFNKKLLAWTVKNTNYKKEIYDNIIFEGFIPKDIN